MVIDVGPEQADGRAGHGDGVAGQIQATVVVIAEGRHRVVLVAARDRIDDHRQQQQRNDHDQREQVQPSVPGERGGDRSHAGQIEDQLAQHHPADLRAIARHRQPGETCGEGGDARDHPAPSAGVVPVVGIVLGIAEIAMMAAVAFGEGGERKNDEPGHETTHPQVRGGGAERVAVAAVVLQHGQRVQLAGDHQHREQRDRPMAAEHDRRHACGPDREMQRGPQQEAHRLRFQQRGEFGVAFAVDLQRGALRQPVGVLGLESVVVAAGVAGTGRQRRGRAGGRGSRCGCGTVVVVNRIEHGVGLHRGALRRIIRCAAAVRR